MSATPVEPEKEKEEVKVNLGFQEIMMDAAGDSEEQGSWFPGAHGGLLLPAKATVAREWISQRREGLKSWREFFRTDKFRVPTAVTVVGQRLVKNVEYFQSNYLFVFIVLLLYCILTSPALIVALAASAGLLYFIRLKASANGGKLKLMGGKEVTLPGQYAIVGLVAFPLFYFAGAGSTIFWVIGASMFAVVLHATFYASEPVPGAEFVTEEV